jgi:hypothetical protein
MERKRYLELCQKNAISKRSAVVLCDGIRYYPEKIQIWFNEKGETQNTAVLIDENENCVVFAKLEKVEEIK